MLCETTGIDSVVLLLEKADILYFNIQYNKIDLYEYTKKEKVMKMKEKNMEITQEYVEKLENKIDELQRINRNLIEEYDKQRERSNCKTRVLETMNEQLERCEHYQQAFYQACWTLAKYDAKGCYDEMEASDAWKECLIEEAEKESEYSL